MKTLNQVKSIVRSIASPASLTACLIVFAIGVSAEWLHAASPPSPGGGGHAGMLDSWSFENTNWLSGRGHAPVALTNIQMAASGNGNAMQIDSTNAAFLQYNVVESDGTTNLSVDHGSLTFWFEPSWSSADQGGTGPNTWGRLIEVGSYTTNATNASGGWWSLYTDPGGTNLYFSAQDTNGVTTNYLSAPISWASNVWHSIALNYSATNSVLFVDGAAITNAGGVTILPGSAALANGFFIGSDSNGLAQARGSFDDLATYNYQLDPAFLSGSYSAFGIFYYGSAYFTFIKAPSNPSSYTPGGAGYNIVGGPGYVQYLRSASNCVTGGPVYLANKVATITTNLTINFTFQIAGGSNNIAYDVFGTGSMAGSTNAQWSWLGQGYTCGIYTLTNQPNATAFYVLGTPKDSDFDGLTDAYERLVSHTNPNNPDSDGDGLPEGWLVLQGLNPQTIGIKNLDPDHDGLSNGQEYLYGTNPQISEGFGIWVGNPAGPAGIP